MATAALIAGNWRKFDSFVWWERPTDADELAIVYVQHRDSGLLDQSNAAIIDRALSPFFETGDCEPVRHSHWAVGYVEGYAIRPGSRAAEVFEELQARMDNYPILDETDYGQREYDATAANIVDAAWRVRAEYDLPEGWQWEVFNWLDNHECGQTENTDDQGGYPEEAAIIRAFEALGYKRSS